MRRLVKVVEEGRTTVEERMWSKRLTLILEEDRCVRCGICVDACPLEALSMTTVGKIIVEEKKCVFCGICDASCPFGAFEVQVDGVNRVMPVEFGVYPTFMSRHEVNDKCLPCTLCREVCPRKAIELHLEMKRKEEIKPFKRGKNGSIEVDRSKCNYCGVCKMFCDAFILIPKEVVPYDILPFKDILVDKDKCDYCKLCESICPEEAVKVTSDEEVVEVPPPKGKILVDEEKCVRCGYCKDVCPYDTIKISRLFEGSIRKNEKKCRRGSYTAEKDCKSCKDICPTRTIYFPKPETMFARVKNVDLSEKYCIYCGACIQLCPEDVFDIERSRINCTEAASTLWKKTSEKLASIRRLTHPTG